jgi:hypothetical protein
MFFDYLTTRLIFCQYRPEQKICVLDENNMLKVRIHIDRHGPRPIMKICQIPEPIRSYDSATLKLDSVCF